MLFEALGRYVWQASTYPLQPSERIFLLYLLSSLVFAWLVYLSTAQRRRDRAAGVGWLRGLFRFLFPSAVWTHPSAWVDVRFFLPHQLVRLWIYTDVMALFGLVARDGSVWLGQILSGRESLGEASESHWVLIAAYALVSVAFIDFAGFLIHYAQHKIPLLWEFHKIHHSAEVLHPLSNYREHPVDNFIYAVGTGLAAGTALGLFQFLFGVQPLALLIPVLGIGLFTFGFNFFGYNLRHSHVWLRWPGWLSYVFGCPAHHQIHHSCRAEHINKNMAFLFPIWDVLFGTYHLPSKPQRLKFGIGDGTESRYRSVWSIYWLPFVDAGRRLLGRDSKVEDEVNDEGDEVRAGMLTERSEDGG